MIIGSFFLFEGTSYGGGKGDDLTSPQKQTRKNSFRASIKLFSSNTGKKTSSQPKLKSSLNSLKQTDFDDWSELENEEGVATGKQEISLSSLSKNENRDVSSNPPKKPAKDLMDFNLSESDEDETSCRLSLGAPSRLLNAKRRLEQGQDIMEILLSSKDWYTRNSTLCKNADRLLKEHKKKEAQELINQASNDGFPVATVKLVQHAIEDNKMPQASYLLYLTCKQLQDKADRLDDNALERLVKGIKSIVKKNPSLQRVFEEFKGTPYFQLEKKDSSPTPPLSTIPDSFYEQFRDDSKEDAEDNDNPFFQLSMRILGNNQQDKESNRDDELIFEDEE